jgi:AbiV family abortive infection protein
VARPDRIIPLAKLPEGLSLLDQNIRDFIVDSKMLVSKGHGWHAIALAIFAFEELGKYEELQRLGDEARRRGEDKVRAKDALFRFHQHKQKNARRLISKDAMILIPRYFSETYFSSKFFQTENESVDRPNLRLECTFVDWVDNDWQHGAPHDTEQLKKFLDAVLDALNKLETKT